MIISLSLGKKQQNNNIKVKFNDFHENQSQKMIERLKQSNIHTPQHHRIKQIDFTKKNFHKQFTNTCKSIKRNKNRNDFKFLKKKNIIQSNKQKINITLVQSKIQRTQRASLPILPKRYNTQNIKFEGIRQNNQVQKSQLTKYIKTSRNTHTQISKQQAKNKNTYFQPKNYLQICLNKKNEYLMQNSTINNSTINESILQKGENGKDKQNKIINCVNKTIKIESQNIKPFLLKNQIYESRCLMGRNIPQLESNQIFSRYQLYNLYTTYRSLLQYSNNSLNKFKKGLQTMLYVNGMSLSTQIIGKCIKDLFNQVSFQRFVQVYARIQNVLLQQNIVQFLVQSFSDFFRQQPIQFNKFQQVLKIYMQHAQSFQIRNYFWQQLTKKQNQTVKLSQVFQICRANMYICKRILQIVGQTTILVNKQKQNQQNKYKVKEKKVYKRRK